MATSEQLGERRTIDLPEGTIEYRERGQGPTLLFVHGIIANGDVWRHVVADLARDHRCITPDWPLGGHLCAMKDGMDFSLPALARLVDEFMGALKLAEVTLVGNDTGGAICQLVAVNHPVHVARLILTPCDAFENFLPPPIRHLQIFGRRPAGLWIAAQALRFPAVYRLPIAFGRLTERPIPHEVMRSYTEPLRSSPAIRRDFAALVRAIDARHTREAAERLRTFDRPTLILWARERRRFFPAEHARALAERLSRARLEWLDDAGPFVTEDRPDAAAGAIRRFLSLPRSPIVVSDPSASPDFSRRRSASGR